MARCVARCLPLFLLLIMSSGIAKADAFSVTFTQFNTGNVIGTAQFTTDGVCTLCSGPAGNGGLLTFTADIGPDTGANAFDIVDDGIAFTKFLIYNRAANTLDSPGATNSETTDFLVLHAANDNWILDAEINGVEQTLDGTYTITPISAPEPSSLALLPFLAAVILPIRSAKRRAALLAGC